MRASYFLDALCDIVTRLETMPVVEKRITALEEWFLEAEALDDVLVVDFAASLLYNAARRGRPDLSFGLLRDYIASLPAEAGVVERAAAGEAALAPVMNGSREFVFVPLSDLSGNVLGALFIFSTHARRYFVERRAELRLVADKIRDMLLIGRLLRAAPDGRAYQDRSAPAASFINRMNIPMFVLTLEGELLSVNQSLLAKLKFANADEFVARCDIFQNLFSREELRQRMERQDGLRGKRLSLTDAAGECVTLSLTAVRMEDLIVGTLFDVSEYVRATDDLRESLKMQEFLNDKLISAALLQQKTVSSAMRALARLAEYRDHHTGDHLQRICEYSRLIAGEIFKRQPYGYKLRSEYCDDIVNSSMLHDIGKVVIPDHILLKQDRLSGEEWKVMQSHTIKGWTILNQADCELGEQSFLTLASQIALNHHERWDGAGYPNGLAGEKIPMSARICAVADVYDALTSSRPYKKAWHHDEAIREIKSMSETAFDPVIVDILLSVEKKMLDIRRRFPK
jgi:response regulator RpfG family c-di-GMP phosphodiesterase